MPSIKQRPTRSRSAHRPARLELHPTPDLAPTSPMHLDSPNSPTYNHSPLPSPSKLTSTESALLSQLSHEELLNSEEPSEEAVRIMAKLLQVKHAKRAHGIHSPSREKLPRVEADSGERFVVRFRHPGGFVSLSCEHGALAPAPASASKSSSAVTLHILGFTSNVSRKMAASVPYQIDVPAKFAPYPSEWRVEGDTVLVEWGGSGRKEEARRREEVRNVSAQWRGMKRRKTFTG